MQPYTAKHSSIVNTPTYNRRTHSHRWWRWRWRQRRAAASFPFGRPRCTQRAVHCHRPAQADPTTGSSHTAATTVAFVYGNRTRPRCCTLAPAASSRFTTSCRRNVAATSSGNVPSCHVHSTSDHKYTPNIIGRSFLIRSYFSNRQARASTHRRLDAHTYRPRTVHVGACGKQVLHDGVLATLRGE